MFVVELRTTLKHFNVLRNNLNIHKTNVFMFTHESNKRIFTLNFESIICIHSQMQSEADVYFTVKLRTNNSKVIRKEDNDYDYNPS